MRDCMGDSLRMPVSEIKVCKMPSMPSMGGILAEMWVSKNKATVKQPRNIYVYFNNDAQLHWLLEYAKPHRTHRTHTTVCAFMHSCVFAWSAYFSWPGVNKWGTPDAHHAYGRPRKPPPETEYIQKYALSWSYYSTITGTNKIITAVHSTNTTTVLVYAFYASMCVAYISEVRCYQSGTSERPVTCSRGWWAANACVQQCQLIPDL